MNRTHALCRRLAILAVGLYVAIAPHASRAQQERPINLGQLPERPAPLGRLEIAGTRITGFVEGSFTWASALRLPAGERLPDIRPPEVAAPTNAGDSAFRFDKFSLGATRRFAPWLLVVGAIEVENERLLDDVLETDGGFNLVIDEASVLHSHVYL